MTLLPHSILKISATLPPFEEWTATRQFSRYDGKIITVTGWGQTRAAALAKFETELFWARESRDFDPLEDLGVFLWNVLDGFYTVQNMIRKELKP